MNEDENKRFHTTGTLLRVFGAVELLYAAWLVVGLLIGAVLALRVPIPLYIACLAGNLAEAYLFWNYGTRTKQQDGLTKEHQRIMLLIVPLVAGLDLLYAALTGSFSLIYILIQLVLPILALVFEMRTMDGRWKE